LNQLLDRLIYCIFSGVISDDAKGLHADVTVYDDSDADQIESIAPTQMHREVDLAITAADAEGVEGPKPKPQYML
jgi:hypothetical protein